MIKNLFKFCSFLVLLCSLLAGFISCEKKKQGEGELKTLSGLEFAAFEKEVQGKQNRLYVMTNANGMEVTVINFGARITSVLVPDNQGAMKDVVLGFESIDDFLNNPSNFGAAIGRYGNRIAKGKFTLDGTEYQLTVNNGENTLHGGITGYDQKMFDITQIDNQTLECTLFSPDGDNGFPGNLSITMIYKLTDDNAIDISYSATTDRPTVVNLTNHSYFNLSGNPASPITDHVLFMDCDSYTPTDAALIPTGEITKVAGTPMDFTSPRIIGDGINDVAFEAIQLGNGYDHNWIVNKPGEISNPVAKVTCPATGIVLEVYTNEPGIQFYAGNFLDGSQTGKNGIAYQQRAALCLETQHYPDSPNKPDFPSTVLRPGEEYFSRCIYKFSVE
jgi:Galactose mutarotase and related enzymes